MRTGDLMRDPYFAGIMVRVEGLIHDTERTTREAGAFLPKDSAVKSALRKAELALGGKKPARKPAGVEEEWIAALSESLAGIGGEMERADGVPKAHFALVLKAVQDSLDRQREMAGQPRGYLDFLGEFMKEARGEG